MEQFTTSSIKQENIGQSIVKAVCARNIIPPVLFSVGTEIDHIFGFKKVN